MNTNALTPAVKLPRNNPVRIPNQSAEYRAAHAALLAQEIEYAVTSSASPPVARHARRAGAPEGRDRDGQVSEAQ